MCAFVPREKDADLEVWPFCQAELVNMIHTLAKIDDQPTALRSVPLVDSGGFRGQQREGCESLSSLWQPQVPPRQLLWRPGNARGASIS